MSGYLWTSTPSIVMAPTNECIIGMDVFSMCTPAHLCSQALVGTAAVKALLVGYVEDYEPIQLPVSNATVSLKQYQLPRERREREPTLIAEVKETKVLCETVSPFSSPVWLVCKASIFTTGCKKLSAVC